MLALVLLLLVPGKTVLADHREYKADDEQTSEYLGKENYAFYHWVIDAGGPLLWWSTSALRNDVLTAKNSWATPLPRLVWWEFDELSSDVRFIDGFCGDGAPACIFFTEMHDGEFEDRNGNYWTKAEIWVNTNAPWVRRHGHGGVAGWPRLRRHPEQETLAVVLRAERSPGGASAGTVDLDSQQVTLGVVEAAARG